MNKSKRTQFCFDNQCISSEARGQNIQQSKAYKIIKSYKPKKTKSIAKVGQEYFVTAILITQYVLSCQCRNSGYWDGYTLGDY